MDINDQTFAASTVLVQLSLLHLCALETAWLQQLLLYKKAVPTFLYETVAVDAGGRAV